MNPGVYQLSCIFQGVATDINAASHLTLAFVIPLPLSWPEVSILGGSELKDMVPAIPTAR